VAGPPQAQVAPPAGRVALTPGIRNDCFAGTRLALAFPTSVFLMVALAMPDEDERARTIAQEVETYLARHPEAADSIDGIIRWWLPRLRLEEAIAELERALDLLVARGVMTKRQLPDGRWLYGRPDRGA
jgi:hypothetical protein